ncbi:glycosyltransferase [Candidatus Saccharibacteria bacterium]|nr:glycosyltransferase [Candidatus Saccharibacteria bacterium]
MRIVIATAVYHPMINGVAVFAHNLAMGLVRRGNEVVVICPSRTGKNYTRVEDGVKVHFLRSVQVKVYPDQIHDVPEKKKILGIKLPTLYRHGFRVSVFPAVEVRKILDEFQPDVVHIQVSDPIGLSVAAYARKNNIPVVTTEHNQPEVLTEPLRVPKLVKKPVDALLSAYFVNRQSKSDFVTMPTKKAIQYLLYSKGREFNVPVAAVSNGVDLSFFKPGKVSSVFYKKYGVPSGRPVVLYVGRVDPEKNVGSVIEAFRLTLAKVPSAVLLIVGDGVDKVRLMGLVEEDALLKKSVIFAGRVVPPDLYEMYRLGSVFATASEIETQGIVLVEAAASGLPLIAVDKGAVSEICVNNENGFLCEPGDIEGISQAMVKILSDDKLRAKFSKKSVEFASEHDFETTLDKFTNIYKRVIKVKKSDSAE